MPNESLIWILASLGAILLIATLVLWRANYSLSSQFSDLYEQNAEWRGKAGAVDHSTKLSGLAMELAKRSEESRDATNAVYRDIDAHLRNLAKATGRLLKSSPPQAVVDFIASNGVHDDRTIALLWTHYYLPEGKPMEGEVTETPTEPEPAEQMSIPQMPSPMANKPVWELAAKYRGINPKGLTKKQIMNAIHDQEDARASSE